MFLAEVLISVQEGGWSPGYSIDLSSLLALRSRPVIASSVVPERICVE